MNAIEQRLSHLKHRLHSAYDGIGHSYGRPYVYLVYDPDKERELRRLVDQELHNDAALTFFHLDLLPIILQTTQGQEARREALLNDPLRSAEAARSLLRLWVRRLAQTIEERVRQPRASGRPVVVLRGLAALHPLGNPTAMMEELAEREPRDPATGQMVPVVVLVPGKRPPQTSREYLFLGQERLRQPFYRGEEA
ncbi:MAG: hypothetical protein OHK0022_33970 [Roseiflexaceae bacterium]